MTSLGKYILKNNSILTAELCFRKLVSPCPSLKLAKTRERVRTVRKRKSDDFIGGDEDIGEEEEEPTTEPEVLRANHDPMENILGGDVLELVDERQVES